MQPKFNIRKGDIFYADLGKTEGSEQGGKRPVLIIQNNTGNRFSPTVIIAAITSQINKAKMPTHVEIHSDNYGIQNDSVILLEQIRTLDKRRLKQKIASLIEEDLEKVNRGLVKSLAL
jgi:mRNA interferase MazF